MNRIQQICTHYGQSVEFLFVNADVVNHIFLFATSSWYYLPAEDITIRNYIHVTLLQNVTPTKTVINYEVTGGVQRKSLFQY
jgi:hypothetical protein